MGKLSTILTAILVSMVAFTAASGQEFSVTLSGAKGPFKSGAEIRLTATVTNTSHHDIRFARSQGIPPDEELSYEIEIRDSQGQTPPLTPFFRQLKEKPESRWGSYLSYDLECGKSFDDQLTISRLYILKPGQYTIRVARGRRPIWQDVKQATALSNVFSVTITP